MVSPGANVMRSRSAPLFRWAAVGIGLLSTVGLGACQVDRAGIGGPAGDGSSPTGNVDGGAPETITVLSPDGGSEARPPDAADGPPSTGPRDSFYVVGKDIFDSCGNKFVARGVNHPTMYVDREGAAVPEIARTGANIVRLLWIAGDGVAITEAEPIITRLEQAGLVAMLQMNDSTCAWSLDGIVRYWTSADAVAMIRRHQRSFWLNIASEATAPNAATYLSRYSDVVRTMRSAGIHVPLVIDASGCGRDSAVLFSQGPALEAADPDHNLIFSWHFYDPLSANQITQVLQQSVSSTLPMVVGEFANRSPPGCGPAIDYRTLLGETQRLGLGWLAWSWGDDEASTSWNQDCPEFDMTRTFAFSTLERWGLEVAVSDTNSIRNTAVRAHGLTGTCP